jgi:hypothetical protein
MRKWLILTLSLSCLSAHAEMIGQPDAARRNFSTEPIPHRSTEEVCTPPGARWESYPDFSKRLCVTREQEALNAVRAIWDGVSVKGRSECTTMLNKLGVRFGYYEGLANCLVNQASIDYYQNMPSKLR